jgi:O-acetyl-ADP-ribose deacetylase (regulator of RNase III)
MIRLRLGDLTEASAQAILRPVAADWSAPTPAMRRVEQAAGAEVAAQLEKLGELPVGSAVITGGGDLPASFLIHAVVRSREEGVTPGGVRRALQNGLRRLQEWGIDSVALAPLGTGAGNLDPEEAAEVMVPVLLEHLAASSPPPSVTILVETDYELEAFRRELRRRGAEIDDAGPPEDVAPLPGLPEPTD